VETLKDLGFRRLDLPPHDLRHSASMPLSRSRRGASRSL
jgi:hypothetical protein